MTRKHLIIAGLLAATGVGGAAFAAQTMIHNGPMRADTDGDGIVSRSEFFTAAETHFIKRDTNSDRVLSGDELKDPRGRFARLDANNDGKLSFTEAATGNDARFERLDADGDGKLTPEELGPRHGPHGRGAGLAQDSAPPPPPGAGMAPGVGMGAGMLRRADTNGDGRISRDEMRAQADQRFDRLDANRDGFIDQAELQAMASRGPGRRGMRQQGMDDMPPPPPPADPQQ